MTYWHSLIDGWTGVILFAVTLAILTVPMVLFLRRCHRQTRKRYIVVARDGVYQWGPMPIEAAVRLHKLATGSRIEPAPKEALKLGETSSIDIDSICGG